MSNDLTNISGKDPNKVNDQKLMDYLNEQLSKEESHDLEAMMADDPFVSDAVEGLTAFDNKKDLNLYVEQLNRDLNKQLDKKKKRREKRKLPSQEWTYVAAVVLLLLCIIAYVLVKRHKDKANQSIPVNTTAQSTNERNGS